MTQPLRELTDRVEHVVRRCALAPGPWLAAVSGGADSTALALVLAELVRREPTKQSLVLCHVDHGQWPASHLAAHAVAGLASRLGARFCLRRLRLGARASEAVMREARYEALVAVAHEVSAATLFTGHHADDQIETILMRILRGTGERGLAGIPSARRVTPDLTIVRPLLGIRRPELESLVRTSGIEPILDPSNLDLERTRNHVRSQLIPALRRRDAGVEATVLRLAGAARVAVDDVERAADSLYGAAMRRAADWRVEVDAERVGDHAVQRELLRRAHVEVAGVAPTGSWLDRAMATAAGPSGRRLVASRPGIELERTRSGLLVVDRGRAGHAPAEACELPLGGTPIRFGTTEWVVTAILNPAPRVAAIDAAATQPPWSLRCERPGDRFEPADAGRERSVRALLQSRNVPRFDRARVPIVVDSAGRILFVPEVGIARFALAPPAGDRRVELIAWRDWTTGGVAPARRTY